MPFFFKSQYDKEEHNTEHPCHDSAPHNSKEALLAIHETRASYRKARTSAQMNKVRKNRKSKYENRKYHPLDSVDFFENMLNPQRTFGVIVEQMIGNSTE